VTNANLAPGGRQFSNQTNRLGLLSSTSTIAIYYYYSVRELIRLVQYHNYLFPFRRQRWSNLMYCVSDPDKPTTPIASDIKQTSVTLSWQPGESQTISSTSIEYRKNSPGENLSSRLVPPSSSRSRRNVDEFRYFVLDGLEPATDYVVRVAVQSFGKVAQSPFTSVETREFRVCFCTANVYQNFFHCTRRPLVFS